ncbi:MAG: hypothetical protein TU35_008545 [Thermoproteus sp. AZ2]|uniref:Uncharacterized protein n=1 Tax=Thermoproteus sp. AZ2 TaxID=1609232 RepID=A0ACC6V3A7_9CREN
MNLSHLPLADRLGLVFLLIAAVSALFTAIIYKGLLGYADGVADPY